MEDGKVIVQGWRLNYSIPSDDWYLYSRRVYNHPKLGDNIHLYTSAVEQVGEDDDGSVWVQTLNTKYYLGEPIHFSP